MAITSQAFIVINVRHIVQNARDPPLVQNVITGDTERNVNTHAEKNALTALVLLSVRYVYLEDMVRIVSIIAH